MSEGGFDLAAYRRQVSGSNPDAGLLVTFRYEAMQQPDGSFKEVPYINIYMRAGEQVDRPVEPQDKIRFKTRWESFLAGEVQPTEGTPIKDCLWATRADIAACKAERIFTLEQIVELPDELLARSHLVKFKYRCQDWLRSQRETGFVAKLRDEIDQLKAQVSTLKKQLGKGEDEVVVVEPKKPGRPKKVKDDALDAA